MKSLNQMSSEERNSAGQAILEFAVVLPVLLGLIVGTVELGRALIEYSTLSRVAYETARYAASQPGLTQGCYDINSITPAQLVHSRVRAKSSELMSRRRKDKPYTLTTARSCLSGEDTADNTVRVQIRATFEPMFSAFPPLPMAVSATAAYLHPDSGA